MIRYNESPKKSASSVQLPKCLSALFAQMPECPSSAFPVAKCPSAF